MNNRSPLTVGVSMPPQDPCVLGKALRVVRKRAAWPRPSFRSSLNPARKSVRNHEKSQNLDRAPKQLDGTTVQCIAEPEWARKSFRTVMQEREKRPAINRAHSQENGDAFNPGMPEAFKGEFAELAGRIVRHACSGVQISNPRIRTEIIRRTRTQKQRRSTPTRDARCINNTLLKTMIDTIKIKPLSQVTIDNPESALTNRMPRWTCRSESLALTHENRIRRMISTAHRENGFRAAFKDGDLAYAEASLPRMMFLSNGEHLKVPTDLETAKINFMHNLHIFAPGARREELLIQRIDLTLNLPVSPRWVLAVHRNARHPRVRRETQWYYNAQPQRGYRSPPHTLSELNTVRFNGTNTRISLYDKSREVASKNGQDWPEESPCTRVEIQLTKKQLIAKLFGFEDREHITFAELDFDQCYRVFRQIMLEFDDLGRVAQFKPNLTSCIAIMEACPETWPYIGDMAPLDWVRATKNQTNKHFRAFRNDVRRQQMALHQFRWADYLLEDRLPDVVDIDADGNPTLIKSPHQLQN